MYLVDPSRTNAPAPGNKGRDIAVQLWYPAAPSKNRFAPYRLLKESTLRASYMSVVPTHSRQDAPVLDGRTPWHVLLFNPAWDNRRGQSTALVEELASQGYVVAAIEHPGRTGPIALPDGRVLPVLGDPDVDDLGKSTVARVEAAIGREVDKEAVDDLFVLDQLAQLNGNSMSPLYQRLDTNRAGVLGHSLGGAVAASACALDPRLVSAFSMSGAFFGKVRSTGLAKPYLNISEEVTLASPDSLARMNRAQRVDAESDLLDAKDFDRLVAQNGGYVVVIRGINHSSFTDLAFYSPLRQLSGQGPTPRARVQAILRQYVVQFFGKTLEGKPSPLLDHAPAISAPFPEVTQRYFAGR
jgi:pimeloyl-ACP methyl ester carboxylesterase